jgi:hypothetical protein
LPDLGAFVLMHHRPGRGFGEGVTNTVALQALAVVFSDPMPDKVTVSLTVDGQARGTEVLSGARLREVLTISARLPAVKEGVLVVVQADPPLPGLSAHAALDYAIPYEPPAKDAGLTVTIELPDNLAVGRTSALPVRALAPGGAATVVTLALPAGVDVVRSLLDQEVDDERLDSYEFVDGTLTLTLPAVDQGALAATTVHVVPMLAGTLQERALRIALADNERSVVHLPPRTWRIAPRRF